MIASLSWPRFGNGPIQEVMRAQRDTYAHLNNNVLYYANKGVTINEIQKESPSLRNSFLAAALELRSGIPGGATPKSAGPDVIRAMGTNLWLDCLAIRLDPTKTAGKHFKINLITPDNGERYVVDLNYDALTIIKGFMAADANLSVSLNRPDLETLMMGAATFGELVHNGKIELVGNRAVIEQLQAMLVQFSPDLEIMPGTKAAPKSPGAAPSQPPPSSHPLRAKTPGQCSRRLIQWDPSLAWSVAESPLGGWSARGEALSPSLVGLLLGYPSTSMKGWPLSTTETR